MRQHVTAGNRRIEHENRTQGRRGWRKPAPCRQKDRGACVLLLLVAGADLAQAQNYPTKPIRLIVPWPAGGAWFYTAARIVAEPLAQRTGGPWSSRTDRALPATSAPRWRPAKGGRLHVADGVAFATRRQSPPHDKLGFEPIRLRARRARLPFRASSSCPQRRRRTPRRNWWRWRRRSRQKLNFGSGGPGSSQHLFGVMFNLATHIDVVHVSYKGNGTGGDRLACRQVDFMLDPPTCLPYMPPGA
jgi:hypothetical protein